MIKLTLRQANQPDTPVQIEGDSATIGRAPGSEVLIQQPYVSKRHVRILKGLVLVDLGSSNGTFVEGRRISEPTLLTGDEFQLGEGDVTVRVARDEPAAVAAGAGDVEKLRAQLAEREEELAAAHAIVDRLHSKAETLRSENQKLRANTPAPGEPTPPPSLASAPAQAAESGEIERLRAELAAQSEARNRIERELEEARGRADQLGAAASRLEGAARAGEEEVGRLKASLAAAASLDELEQLRGENERLRSEVERLRAELDQAAAKPEPQPAVPAGPMGDLLIRLQAENSSLKRQLSSGSHPVAPPAAEAPRPTEPPPSKLLAELLELRAQHQALKAQLGAGRGAPLSTHHAAAHHAAAQQVPALHVAPASAVASALGRMADVDIERSPSQFETTPDEFVAAELFRVTRSIERVITRIAGDHIQLFQSNTMLPDVEGNLRGLVATILADPSEMDARRELTHYFDQMGKWLVAALAANRKATKQFVEKLKSDLSPEGLTAQGPIPAYRRLAGGYDAELWKRACTYLRELTPDMLDDALEKLSREAVKELLGPQAS